MARRLFTLLAVAAATPRCSAWVTPSGRTFRPRNVRRLPSTLEDQQTTEKTASSSSSSSSSSSPPAKAPPEAQLFGRLSGEKAGSFPAGVGVYCHDDWVEAWQTCDDNIDYEIDEVEGEVPQELRGGELFRAGPGRFERGDRRYRHVLDGDGFVLKVAFPADGEGKPRVKGKFVRTAWFEAEEAADEIKFRNTFGSQPDGAGKGPLGQAEAALGNLLNLELKNVANTNAQYWGGRLLSLWEAGMPHEMDPDSLDTLGPSTLGGFSSIGRKLEEPDRYDGVGQPVDTQSGDAVNSLLGFGGMAFSAHPHYDLGSRTKPRGGEGEESTIDRRLVGWGWTQLAQESSMRVRLREFDEAWKVAAEAEFVMKDCKLAPHDFAVTPDYYLFMENRMSMAMAPYILGQKGPAEVLTMMPEDPVRLHVVPRPGGQFEGQPTQVLDCPSWFCIHLSHASQSADGASIELFGSGWPKQERGPNGEAPEFLGAWGGEAPTYDVIPLTNYWRTSVELRPSASSAAASSSFPRVTSHAPFPSQKWCCEHPHIHPDFECGVHDLQAREAWKQKQQLGASLAEETTKLATSSSSSSSSSRRLARREARFAYMSVSNEVGMSTAPCGWVRFDLWTGDAKPCFLNPRRFSEEIVIVPKANAAAADSNDGDDDDGMASARCWLLGMFYDAEQKRSALAVVDGETMERVATLWMKHVSPHGLHGSWKAPPVGV